MTQLTAHELVARGAALLDSKLPGWADQIDLDALKLDDACACVLGQIGQKQYNLDRLSWDSNDGRAPSFVAFGNMIWGLNLSNHGQDYGFDATPNADSDAELWLVSYGDLQDAWKGEIVARRTL